MPTKRWTHLGDGRRYGGKLSTFCSDPQYQRSTQIRGSSLDIREKPRVGSGGTSVFMQLGICAMQFHTKIVDCLVEVDGATLRVLYSLRQEFPTFNLDLSHSFSAGGATLHRHYPGGPTCGTMCGDEITIC